MWIAGLAFALVGGLVGEAIEVWWLGRGGIAPAGWGLRLTLFAGYAGVAAACHAAAVVTGRRGRSTRAVFLLACGLVLPWLNLDFLPRLATLRSVAGNLLAVALVAAAAPIVARYQRAAAALAVAVAVAVNLWRLPPPAPQPDVPHGALPPRPVNVMVLLIDALRADHLGTYGYPRPTSPHLDRVAAAGVVFEHAWAQSPWTKPSVASLMTGTYAYRHKVVFPADALGPDLPTLAEVLRRHGYRTAAFSGNNWITSEFGFGRGFMHFEGPPGMNQRLTILGRWLKRGRRLFCRAGGAALGRWWAEPATSDEPARADAALAASLERWLVAHHAEPFFVYLHLLGPHWPYEPPSAFARFAEQPVAPGLGRYALPRIESIFERAAPLDESVRQGLLAQYDGAVAYADAVVGGVVATLDRLGVLERTLLVLLADHGEAFYDHGKWSHGNSLYEELVRVPLIFRLPPHLRPARRTDAAMLVDVFPTILGVLGLAVAAPAVQGRDLFAGVDATRPAFSELWRRESGGTIRARAMRRGAQKVIEIHELSSGRRHLEGYDIGSDPGERRNVVLESAAASAEFAALQSLLEGFGAGEAVGTAPVVDIQPETLERLRALGY
jgi:arylsulfatase A-like enzyme